ncbi:hypothetical protein [Streptomyces avermitilis]|uniref:hypothetical protein n=1 Tax=Streptomyces avermitilis TaxID=33903 RepID=UPI003680F551
MENSHRALQHLPAHSLAGRPFAELADAHRYHPPIYAQLVAEWKAEGRQVPERRDVQWASFAAASCREERRAWPVLSWAGSRQAPTERGSDTEPVVEQEAERAPAVPVPRGIPDV